MKKIMLIMTIMASASGAFAQDNQKPMVHVNGEHIIKVAPDEAEVNFMVSSQNKDLQEAKKQNDAIVSKALEYLEKQGLDESDVRTTNVNIFPYNEYVKDEKPIQKFKAQQSITVKVSDLDKLADLLSGLVDLGVNNIQGVEFQSSQKEELLNQARAEAMLDAKAKAGVLAGALGQKIGAAYSITDNTSVNNHTPRPMYMARADMAMKESSQEAIAPGEIEIKANVSVSFLLAN